MRIFTLFVVTLLSATACGGSALTTVDTQPAQVLDPPSTHGMLLFGEGPVFLSHLPMFHAPHDYQVILKVSLAAPDTNALQAYRDDRAAHPGIYTFVPKSFSLNALVATEERLREMPGTIYRGHFERGGTPLLDVVAHVDHVVHFRRFKKGAGGAATSYLLFGDPSVQFLAHRIEKAPDFDQILRIEPTALPAAEGLELSTAHTGPLPAAGPFDATWTDRDGRAQAIRVAESLYLETGDLAED